MTTKLIRLGRVACLATLISAAACSEQGTAPAGPTPPPPPSPTSDVPSGPFTAGTEYTHVSRWIQYTAGDAPLVIIAPHGGTLAPAELRDRNCSACVTVNDQNTQDLARRIAVAFAARTGRRPHLVVNLLSRRKFDANRALIEATDGNTSQLGSPWRWMHGVVDSAKADVARRWQRGLVIDLHGHAHTIQRLELGYLLTASQLRLSDAELTSGNALASSSIARLIADARTTRAPGAMLRGATSLGGLIEARGYPAVPSPAAPAPLAGEAYFNGGYNTDRHGSSSGGMLDAIQIECHFAGVRDTEANRTAFADALADALIVLLTVEYGWQP